MEDEKFTQSMPSSSTGEAQSPHQPRKYNFPGRFLVEKDSHGLSRQLGSTIGLGWTIKK